jgi:hypothetical protein
MKLIDKLYSMGEEAINLAKRPFTVKKVSRAYESAIDSLDAAIVENEEKVENYKVKIAKGNLEYIKKLAEVRLEIEEAEKEKTVIKSDRDALFADAPKEGKEEK